MALTRPSPSPGSPPTTLPGGWISLATQIHYPAFYGERGFYPDPIDFRRYQLVNIYEDTSAFLVPNAASGAPERMFQRTNEGQYVREGRLWEG